MEWLAAAGSMPAEHISLANYALGGLLMSGSLIFVGYSLQNAATTAGTVTFKDGQDANGPIVVEQVMAASSSITDTCGNVGILHELGLFMSVNGGVYAGAVWVIPLWRYEFTPPGS